MSTRAEPGMQGRDRRQPVPGTVMSCVLITILTVLLAVFSGHPSIDPVLRAAYFAVLYGAFYTIRRREPSLKTTSYRLIESGFQILTSGFLAAAVLRLSGLQQTDQVWMLLSECFERGAVFLLGISLITYGILLSMPAIIESYRILRKDYDQTRGRLRRVESSNLNMEQHIVEAERYRALGELAAGVAHDLRNPLTIVKTAAAALSRKPRSQDFIEEHCRVIGRNIERAERTITALLDLGKPRQLSPREHDISELCAEVVTLVRPEARRRKVELRLRNTTRLDVVTDQKLFGQAFLNLLLNALQASASGSTVEVKIKRLTRGGTTAARIVVEDRGSGLQAADRSKLFSPFFTTKDGGTGLGLLSCRRILDDLGGRIGLFPRHRGGARAIVLLPLADECAVTATTATTDATAARTSQPAATP